MLQGMSVESGKRLACAYYEIGEDYASRRPDSKDDVSDDLVARITAATSMIAFACELSMKLVLFDRGIVPRGKKGHDLKELFNLLGQKDQKLIRCLTDCSYREHGLDGINEAEFAEKLEVSRWAFTSLRYWHELPGPEGGRRAEVLFMRCFGWAVIQWMDQRNP